MKKQIQTASLFLVFIFFTASCTMFSKKSDIEGPMADDIVNKDIDSDSRGSDSGRLEGLETVYFAYDSSTLSDIAKQTLRSNMDWLKKIKEFLE